MFLSFRHALRGLVLLLRTETNARVHAAVTVAVIGLGLVAGLGRGEWALISLATAAVWMAEGFNTALEALCDVACPERHPTVARAKDIAAAAVLVSAVGAAVTGVVILGPSLLEVLA